MNFKKYLILLFALVSIQESYACPGTDVQLDIVPVSCFNGNNGSIEVVTTLVSDHLPYTYSINGGSFTSNPLFSGLTAGTYQIVIKNSLGCDYTYPNPIEIEEPSELNLQIEQTPIICGNDGKLFATIGGGVGPYFYNWNNDPTLNLDTLRNIAGGTYHLRVQDQNNCIVTDSIVISPVAPFLVEVFASEVDITIGDIVELTSTVTGGGSQLSYQWFPSTVDCSTCDETSGRFFNDTEVILVVHDLQNGCVGSDSVRINVEGTFSLFIPNAFSPNGDSKNEKFLVYGVGILTATLNIYDKNGFLVFQGESYTEGWDGTVNNQPAREGLYFYHANVVYTDGTFREQKGQINLIR